MEAISQIFYEWIDKILIQMGCTSAFADSLHSWVVMFLIVLVALMVDLILRLGILRVVRELVSRTKADWDDRLFDKQVMGRLCNLITPTIIYTLLPLAFSSGEAAESGMQELISRCIEIYMVITCVRFINIVLKVAFEIAEKRPAWEGKPIKGLMQTGQVFVIGIGTILIVSILINKSPVLLLTGLGASAAVLMLIFKDSILGLVAGVQLSANNMLKVGDWISMPKYGVDGEVEEVALTTIKVRGWDKTLQMLPPYLLISESFQNWQAMRATGGRRIKRSLNIDMSTIRFADNEFISNLYQNQMAATLLQHIEERSDEGEMLTNLDLFMRCVNSFLRRHPRVNPDMTIMVRQLQPSEWGLPIEIYCFSADVNWIPYENLQTEIISYVVAIAPLFGLRMYQAPSGLDFRRQ